MAEVFEAALTLPAHERDAYLASQYPDHPEIRAEVNALLEAVDSAPSYFDALARAAGPIIPAAVEEFVDAQSFDALDSRSVEDAPALADEHTGRRIRHYQVRGRIGKGGMGVVYKGYDLLLRREVALKFLPSAVFSDAAARQRLIREARAVSSLDSPYVCGIHGIEETDDGGLCLVMSYCAGGTLKDRLRRESLRIAEVVAIAQHLVQGLASAHRQQVLHRDLKPANIGFSTDGTTRLLDFGIALRIDDDETLSVEGIASFSGTVPYSAPEIVRGAKPDVRSDLWSFGVVLYEMVAGRRPFTGANDSALLHAILYDAPPEFRAASGEPVPDGLRQLISDLLTKDPAERPTSAEEVRRRLEQVHAAPELVRPRSSTRRLGWLTLAIVTIALGFVLGRDRLAQSGSVGAAVASHSRLPAKAASSPSLAVMPFTVRGGTELAYLREGLIDLMVPAFDATGVLHGVDPNTVIAAARDIQDLGEGLDGARRVAERVGATRFVVGSVVQTGARITLRATMYRLPAVELARSTVNVPTADSLLLGVEGIVRQLATSELGQSGDSATAQAVATTASTRALRAYLDGERELRDARPAAAVAHFTSAVREDSLFALAWYRLARAARWSADDSVSVKAAARAYALSGTLPLRSQLLIRGYHTLRFGSPIEAERQFRRVVADYPSDVDGWMLLGETMFENNPYIGRPSREAGAAFERVMALDPRYREVTVYLMELAARARRLGQLDTLYLMYFSPNSAGEQPGIRETYMALHTRLLRGGSPRITDPVGAHTALFLSGLDDSERTAARQFASTIVGLGVPAHLRVDGLLALASLDVVDGRFERAEQRWQEAAAIDADMTLLHRGLILTANGLSIPAVVRSRARAALQPEVTRPVRGLASDEHSALRLYVGGLLSIRLDDSVSARLASQQLGRMGIRNRLARPLGAALTGHLFAMQKRWPEALSAFEKGDIAIPADLRREVPGLTQISDRKARADVLSQLNRAAEAAIWRASVTDGTTIWDGPLALLPE